MLVARRIEVGPPQLMRIGLELITTDLISPPSEQESPRGPGMVRAGYCRGWFTENGWLHDQDPKGPEESPPTSMYERLRGRSRAISPATSVRKFLPTSRQSSLAPSSTVLSQRSLSPREVLKGMGVKFDDELRLSRLALHHDAGADGAVRYPARIYDDDLEK
jgi:hypothetical protein